MQVIHFKRITLARMHVIHAIIAIVVVVVRLVVYCDSPVHGSE
jgi:hypothetical protein